MTRDPKSGDGPWGSDGLRDLLSRARRDVPEARMRSVATRLGLSPPSAPPAEALQSPAASPTAVTPASGPVPHGSARLPPWALVAGLAATAVVVGLALVGRERAPVAGAASPVAVALPATAPAVVPGPAPMPAPAPAAMPATAPATTPATAPATTPATAPATTPTSPPPAPHPVGPRQVARRTTAALPSEPALLRRAREALVGSPAEALALAARHAALFPDGVLAQEREVIAIEALTRLDRGADARARAARFLAAYPGSPHESRVRELTLAPSR